MSPPPTSELAFGSFSSILELAVSRCGHWVPIARTSTAVNRLYRHLTHGPTPAISRAGKLTDHGGIMRTSVIVLSCARVALMASSSLSGSPRPDDALKSALALAAQLQPYQAPHLVSPTNLQHGAT